MTGSRRSASLTSTTGGSTPGPVGPAERAPIRVTRPSVVTQLASNAIGGFSGYSSTRVPREAALLESSLMVGASFSFSPRTMLGVELYQDSEEFAVRLSGSFDR